MEYALLGGTGIEVSRLVLGTMTFGAEADRQSSAAIYAAARDAGITTFDTADKYADGESERILGQLIAGHRDEILIASKAGTPLGHHRNARGASRLHLIAACDASLHRLGIDHLDIYYVHYFDPRTELDDTLRTLDDLVRSGKVRYIGLSNFAAWQMMKAVLICDYRGWAKPALIQPMYSLLKRQAEVEILPMAASEGLGVMVYSPLAAGILSGKYGTDAASVPGRINENDRYHTRYRNDAHFRIARAFAGIAEGAGIHPATLATRWVLNQSPVTSAIIGARNLAQLEPTLRAAEAPLTAELQNAVEALAPAPPLATDREEERVARTQPG